MIKVYDIAGKRSTRAFACYLRKHYPHPPDIDDIKKMVDGKFHAPPIKSIRFRFLSFLYRRRYSGKSAPDGVAYSTFYSQTADAAIQVTHRLMRAMEAERIPIDQLISALFCEQMRERGMIRGR